MKQPSATLKRENTLSKGHSVLIYILLLAVTIRVLHLVVSKENPLLYMPVLDERYYIEMGKAIGSGQLAGGETVFFMDPLYGYFLGALFFFFGDNLTTVRLFQIVMDAVNVLLIYGVASKLLRKGAGYVAALAYALYPLALFYSLLILKTTVTTTALLFFTLYLLIALEKRKGVHWFCFGLVICAMTYLRGNMVLLLPLTILIVPISERLSWRGFLGGMLLLVVGFMALLPLGIFRNYRVSGEFVLMNSQAGRLFYSCNNPRNLTGRYNVPDFARPDPVDSERDFHKEAERRTGLTLDSSQASRYWMREAFRFFKDEPGVILELLTNKVKGTVGNCEIANNHSFYSASDFSPLLRWFPLPFAFAFALGIPGLVLGIIRNPKAALLLIPLLTVLTTMLLFYTSSRFRMPLVPYLLIGMGMTCCIGYDWIRGKRIPQILLLLLIVGICGWVSLKVACPKPSGTEEFLLGKAYWRQKDFKSARRIVLKGLNDFPNQARFHILSGMIAFSEGRPDDAVAHNRRAILLDERNVDAFFNLGLVYLETNRPKMAVQYFEKAFAMDERPDILLHLATAHEKNLDPEKAAATYDRLLQVLKDESPMAPRIREKLEKLEFYGQK